MEFTSIRAKNYKLFDQVCLPELKKVNVIIGKNNSGKSSLIDIISAAYDVDQYKKIYKNIGEIIASTTITKSMTDRMFSGYSSLDGWTSGGYYGEVEGKDIHFCINYNPSYNSRSKVFIASNESIVTQMKQYWHLGLNEVEEKLNKTKFYRMSSERDIVPEGAFNDSLSENGKGASSLIKKFILDSNFDENIIEEKLLGALNDIMYPDAKFETIKIQQVEIDDKLMWEVFLQEKDQIRVPLSKMGSGLKTIILILLNLIVIPKLTNNNCVYAFEEVENNLHPALQRRIFEYIYNYAISNNVTIYLTTHSHVAINCFFDREQANIYHVEKKENGACVKKIETYIDKAEILSDLDVKASDILQSNGIIWVEGPSDRIYIKRWLEILTDNEYTEGKHFQFLYYGGKLLSHYSAQEEADLINILTTNRNAAIVIDSDKRNKQASINATKKRIKEEFDSFNMFAWITKGKEVENYLPVEAIQLALDNDKMQQCKMYQLFPEYIEKDYKGFSGKKILFAKKMVPYLTMDNCRNMLDLSVMIKKLYANIEKWNN